MRTAPEHIAYEAWIDQHPLGYPGIEYDAFVAGYRAALQSQDREDAFRYRWLRNRASTEGICVVHIDYWSDEYRGQAHCEVYDGEFLDKEVDRARRIEGDS